MRLDLASPGARRWALEAALALTTALGIFWLWSLTGLPRLGREPVWFALGWFLLMALPTTWAPPDPLPEHDQRRPSLGAEACHYGAMAFGLMFLALLVAGRFLGNYKLWLGIVYLLGIHARLAGLSLLLRRLMLPAPRQDLRLALALATLAALAGLLIIPWVRPDLAAQWPPPLAASARPVAAALLWGAVCGAVFLARRLWGAGARGSWLVYLALALGPGPALAVAWFEPLPLSICLLVLLALCLPRLLRPAPQAEQTTAPPEPLPLYWLARGLMLLWWGVGAAITLALAWWQPGVETLFTESIWLRGVGLGAFLVACAGLLAEYSLPLLGRPELPGLGAQRKSLGVLLSSLAILASLSPLLMVRPTEEDLDPPELLTSFRAEVLSQPRTLDPAHPEMEISLPTWLNGINRVLVVSLLAHGGQVPQGAPVAQLVATDDQDIPHIYSLRAGVDTAEWAIDKREVANHVKHQRPRPARTWQVFDPSGEAFQAHSYFTGLFLGTEVNHLKTISLRYLYTNPPGAHPVTLEIQRILLN